MKAKRILEWIAAGCVLLLIVAAVGGSLYLKSNSFQRFAIRRIVAEVDSATGGKAGLAGFNFDLKTLTVNLSNITLRGTEGPDEPPLLHADKLTLRIKVVSALHRKFSLDELLIEHPVLHVLVGRDGKSNLPTAPPSQSSSHTSVFDLAVRHVQLSNGEVDYNDSKTPLAADFYDLGANIRFESLARRYLGSLSYSNGHLRYAQYPPLAHSLNLNFSATPQQLKLSSLTLAVGSSKVDLSAQVSNYSNPDVDGEYHIQLHTQDLATRSPSISPSGELFLAGKVHYQPAENQPFVRTVFVEGRIASDVLRAVASTRRIELRKLEGTYRIANGNLQIPDLSVETFGGGITAFAEVKHLDSTPQSSVRARLNNISLKAIQRALGQQDRLKASLSGTLGGTAAASWRGSISNLRARSDLAVRAVASSRSQPWAQEVPVSGSLHLAYDGRRQTIDLRDTAFRIPTATLTAQGSLSNQSHLQVQVTANDLHQLISWAASFSAASGAAPAISGSATANATVHGSMKQPSLSAQLAAHNLHVEGSEWRSAKLSLQASPSGIEIENASLVNAHRGEVNLTARVALRQWSYDSPNPIAANLQVKHVRLSELQALARQNYPISGDLSANVDLSGSELQPKGTGSATIDNARAYGESIQNLSARFEAENGSIVSTLNLSAAAGSIDASVSFTPKTKAYKVELDAPSIALNKIQTLREKNLETNGVIRASVNGEGTLDNPELTATVQLPQLQIKQTSLSGFKADIRVSQHRADLNLDTRVSAASVHAHGDIALTGNYEAEAVIDTGTIPLDALVAAYAATVPQGFQGQTELHATLKGPLQDRSRLEAHVSIPVLQAKYQELQIGIPRPIRADYANSVVTLQPAEIRGTGTSLRVQGRIPVDGSAPPEVTAQGSVDLRILQIVAPNVKSSGALALDVHSSGLARKPELQGQVQIKNVALTTVDAPIGVEKLNGTLDINDNRIQVSTLTAQVGGGQVSVAGSISYKPALQFNLAVQGKSVRLLYPEGLRSLLDANLTFTGSRQASMLSGRVLIDNLSFTPDFDLSSFSDQFSSATIPAQPGYADTIRLAITLQSGNSLNAVSSQISVAGQAALEVGGTADNPVITGRTTLNSGELFFNNVRYQLQRGVITFDDPNETHPVLNVSVTTTVEQYNLTLTMRGPLDKLTTSYASDPPLATADIINLVARGKTTEEQAASSQSTDSMIASQVTGQLSSGVQKLAGISSLQIDPTLGGNNSNPSARVAIQQRVTKDLLFSFSTDVSQPGSEIVQGEYQINQRWSVTVTRDQLGGVSVDGRFHKKF
jgi:translocation and assembly module TamB